MGLARHRHEPGILIDLACGDQDALRPQRDPAIAAGLRERDAFGDEASPEPMSAPGRIDQQQTQFGDVVRVPHQKDRADGAPSSSAIQQRSREASNEVRNFAAISATSASNEESKPYSLA